MLTKGRLIQLIIMLLLLIALVWWRTMDSANKLPNQIVIDISEQVQNCDYLSPCKFISKQGPFWLSVKSPIKAEQWIDFKLQSQLRKWQVKTAKIVGKSMFMGRIPVVFKITDEGFSARTMVGGCTSAEMVWQLQISIDVNGVSELLLFDFIVRH
ncbi:hypothetical protein [Psychromonas antarctica]|jgi:hypothetical protein|uniref:hypothetical protein n=1 Tax=Psychromonas antarctica TaxID=67573 RepID=UPI001EE83A46|nr:hypothetical protein [Psychromonas antarctica]MCG6201359.1 hypothetical protein [Psychromonas antarctica]